MDRQQERAPSEYSARQDGLRILAQIIARAILDHDPCTASSDDSSSVSVSLKALCDSDTLIGASSTALSLSSPQEV